MRTALLLFLFLPVTTNAQAVWTERAHPEVEILKKPIGKKGLYLIPTEDLDFSVEPTAQKYLRSTDGITWTKVSFRLSTSMVCMNNRFVAVGDGEVFATDDGTAVINVRPIDPTWTGPFHIAYGNNRWVIVSRDGHVMVSTDDSASWTAHESSAPFVWDITFGGGQFVVQTPDSSLRSADGVNWTPGPEIQGVDLCYEAGQWATDSFVSTDAVIWHQRTLAQRVPGDSLRAGDGIFLSWDKAPQPSFYTSDGQTWSSGITSGVPGAIADANLCGDLWIATTSGGKILTSPIPSLPASAIPVLNLSPGLRLSWQSTTDRSYVVQRSPSLNAWTDATGALPGTGAMMEWTIPAASSKEFFRLQIR